MKFKLKKPKSISLAYEVVILFNVNPRFAIGAAIGICWDGKPFDGNKFGDFAEYGAGVIDQLVSKGMKYDEIFDKGQEAVELCVSILPQSEEVEEIEENFEKARD